MRISELGRASGVPVPTVKYYLREGLLPPGRATGRNQADYGEEHLRRLRLVRTLVEVGKLGIAAVRRVVAAVEDESLPRHELLGVAQYALGPEQPPGPVPPDVAAAVEEVGAFVGSRGWTVAPDAPARRLLADALVALRRLGYPAGPEIFAPYAEVADRLAADEVALLSDEGPPAVAVEQLVIGTVVIEAALVALRRMAHEHHSARRFRPARPSRQPRPSRTPASQAAASAKSASEVPRRGGVPGPAARG